MRNQVLLYPILMTTLRYSDLLEHVSTQHKPQHIHKNMLKITVIKMANIRLFLFLVTRTPPPATSLSSEDFSITGDIHIRQK